MVKAKGGAVLGDSLLSSCGVETLHSPISIDTHRHSLSLTLFTTSSAQGVKGSLCTMA